MLTRFLLTFQEKDAKAQYLQQQTAYYSRMLPILAALMCIHSLQVEVAYRLALVAPGLFFWHTTVFNWTFTAAMICFAILIRKHAFVRHLACPVATSFVFYYYSVLDFGESPEALYN
jgi:hypothetical protein